MKNSFFIIKLTIFGLVNLLYFSAIFIFTVDMPFKLSFKLSTVIELLIDTDSSSYFSSFVFSALLEAILYLYYIYIINIYWFSLNDSKSFDDDLGLFMS